MKWFRETACIFLLSGFFLSLSGQYELSNYDKERLPGEYNLLGTGARAAGMGYAFNAVADDASGIFWNPGGTAFIKDPQYTLSGHAFTDYLTRSEYGNINTNMIYYPDFAGIVFPLELFGRTLSFGAAYQNMITRESWYFAGGNLGRSEMEYRNYSTVNTLMISAAYAISGNIYFGGSYNRWFSLGKTMSGYNYSTNNHFNYQRLSVISGRSVYKGNNFSLGLLTDLSSTGFPLRFGIKFESPFKLRCDFYQLDSVFYAFNYDTLEVYTEMWDGIRTYNMPWKLSVGLSYRVGDFFTLAADYDIKPFKNATYTWNGRRVVDFPHLRSDSTYSQDFYMTEGNEHLNQFRLGMEVILHPRDLLIPFRLGLKTNRTSLGTYNRQWQLTGPTRAGSVNIGLGWIMEGFSVDFAYELYGYFRVLGEEYEMRLLNFFTLSGIVSL